MTSRRPPPDLIQHSDRGSQYTSSTYGEILDRSDARQSIGRPGTYWDKCGRRELLCVPQERTDLSARLAQARLHPGGHPQLHRGLVQPGAPPFDTQLFQPDLIRGALLSSEHIRLIVLTNPSVKGRQHQRDSGGEGDGCSAIILLSGAQLIATGSRSNGYRYRTLAAHRITEPRCSHSGQSRRHSAGMASWLRRRDSPTSRQRRGGAPGSCRLEPA